MSAFGDERKNDIVAAIRDYAEQEIRNGTTARQLLENIMGAVTYGIDEALHQMEQSK